MGNDNRRSLGFVNNKRRSETRFHYKTSLYRGETDKCDCPKFRYFTSGGKCIIRKRCNRTCTSKQYSERFLLNIFSGSKKVRRFTAGNKFAASQQVSQETAFQNGLLKHSFETCSARRLGDFSRFEGCLFAYPNVSSSQKVPTVLHSGQSLPVQLPLFWPNGSAKGVHEIGNSNSSLSQDAKCSSGSVFGRLVCSESNKKDADVRQREIARSSSETRVHSQSGEILVSTKSVSDLHRGSFSFRQRSCLPNSGENFKDQTGHSGSKERNDSSQLSSAFRSDGIMHRTSPKCSTIHEANSAPSASFLETSNHGPSGQSSSQLSFTKPLKVVAESKEFKSRQKVLPRAKLKNYNDRCFNARLWGSFGRSNFSRHLVRAGKDITHKFSGVKGCSFNGKEFFATAYRPQCSDQIRQYHGGAVHKQTGGNKVTPAMLPSLGLVESGNKEPGNVESSPCSRLNEHSSGPSKSRKNTPNRMVSEQFSCSQDISDMGQTINRSVCIRDKSENADILLLDSQSDGTGNRCIVNFLGKHGGVCISPNLFDSQSNTTYEEVSLPNPVNSPSVAEEELVHESSSNVNCMSNATTSATQSIVSTQNNNLSSESGGVQSCCMAAIDRSFQNKGFSKDTKKLMAASWRAGTRKDYQVKFHKFHSWCSQREINPYSATLNDCIEFLTSLYNTGLKYRTIAGYRSMLSVLLPQVDKVPIGQHPDIIRLLKGVFNTRPPEIRLVPEWNLKQVLDSLCEAPFEPMFKASLKYITWKSVFLTAISTFRRCSDIQALRTDEGYMSILPEGIVFIRQGIPKQGRPGHLGNKIFVPCFKRNKKLDPKRAIQVYLKKTEHLRNMFFSGSDKETQLFISLNKPHKAVSKQTISTWIVNVIKQAYDDSDVKVKAHSTRAIGPSWALFKGASLASILEAADWSKDSTFKKFYYRDMNSQEWEF